jgi:hypothetical protein
MVQNTASRKNMRLGWQEAIDTLDESKQKSSKARW